MTILGLPKGAWVMGSFLFITTNRRKTAGDQIARAFAISVVTNQPRSKTRQVVCGETAWPMT